MLLNRFYTKEARALGSLLGEIFVKHIDARVLTELKTCADPASMKTARALLEETALRAAGLQLSRYQFARLLGSFKSHLFKQGFSPDEVTLLEDILIRGLHEGVYQAPKRPTGVDSIDLKGLSTTQLLQQIQRFTLEGRIDTAMAILQECVRNQPDNPVFASNLGGLLLEAGRTLEAKPHLERAVQLNPHFGAAQLNLGSLLRWEGDLAGAERHFRRAVKFDPDEPKGLVALASVFLMQGELKQSEHTYREALRRERGLTGALCGLGSIYAQKGQRDVATAYFEQALQEDPRCVDALIGLNDIVRDDTQRAELADRMQALLDKPISYSQRTGLLYALGDYYDKLPNPKKAFCSYQAANELKKTSVPPYDAHAHHEDVTEVIEVYSAERLSRRLFKGNDTSQPVFVVGMMRSGTSLVEQIIASHPDAFGAGELDFWNKVYEKQRALFRLSAPDVSIEKRSFKKLSEAYLKELQRHSNGALRVVDKSTANLMYLGMIHEIFPNARILCLRRNPIDTCLSCYFKNFANGAAFTMDLTSLTQYYTEHLRLIEHWREALPQNVFLEVPYEALIENQEQWSRKIIEFIGLQWDPRVLEFHQTNRVVRTASNWQVRERLYTRSIERWKAYRRFIGPLLTLGAP